MMRLNFFLLTSARQLDFPRVRLYFKRLPDARPDGRESASYFQEKIHERKRSERAGEFYS